MNYPPPSGQVPPLPPVGCELVADLVRSVRWCIIGTLRLKTGVPPKGRNGMGQAGRFLLLVSIVITGVGLLLMLTPRIPCLGRMPGDVHLCDRNWSMHSPLATSQRPSAPFTIALWLIFRLKQ